MKEIVIKIPEHAYEECKKAKLTEALEGVPFHVMKAIANGTELPKGHGELKNIGKCDKKLFYQQCGGADSLITVKTAFDMLLSLPTIIEADKENDE